MTSQREPELSESQARRASALKSALGPLTALLDDPRVVEVMLNADGVVWVERVGEGVVRTRITVSAADAERMLRLVASEVLVELNPQSPSLSAKLPPPWGARLQAAIPPIVDAPVFALRKPARIVFSLDDYVSREIATPAATVPGVSPRVRLLLELYTALRIRRSRALFAYLARTRRDPSALTDGFYVRVGVALAGRLPEPKILRSFLSTPPAPSDSWT